MKCVACLQGDLQECRQEGNCDSASSGELGLDVNAHVPNPDYPGNSNSPGASVSEADNLGDGGADGGEASEEKTFVTYKDDSVLRDQQSTGRKRAAKMYPLNSDADCEWRMQKNCGGGQMPIIGCLSGKQTDRHHGPDKNTLNNERGNVHRICSYCHNRWHTLNDPDYVSAAIHDPHNPLVASSVDIALNEDFWSNRKMVKAKD